MVRKKRKGVVKEADAEGASAARRPRVDLGLVLRDAPRDAALPFALAAADSPVEAAQPVKTLATWYALLDASRDLFDQLKVLQLFRSKVKALLVAGAADERAVAFAAAAWRLVFRLYAAPACEPLRKNFFLILDALAAPAALDASEALRQQLEATASEEMRLFLDKLLGGAQAKAQTLDEIVATFDAMLLISDFPFLARVLVGTAGEAELRRFVAYSAQNLAVLAEPVTRFQQNASASDAEPDDASATSVVLVASERCGHALKNVILLTTMKDALYQRATQPIVDDFLAIAQVCAQILQTSVVHKDLLTQAALAYCLALRLLLFTDGTSRTQSVDDDTVAKQLLSAAYSGQKVSLGASPLLHARLEEDPAAFGELSRLAVFRGVLNSLADNELLLNTQGTQLCGEDGNVTTIMDALFKSGQQFCQHESLNVRLYAFQVLEAFLRRAVLITQNQAKDASATGDLVKAKAVAYNTLASLTGMVLLNWEHPSKKVNQFMPPMFTHIVNYFVLTGDFDGWKQSIVAKLVSLPSHSRAKYGALSIVADKYGIKSLLAEYPSLMRSVLVAVGHKDVLSAAVASLFSQLFDAGAEEGADMKRVWLADVAHVLVSEDAVLRARVAMYIMPLLLKKNPAFVVLLIEQLRATLEDSKTTADLDTVLWAIIEVVKYARKKFAPEKLAGLSFREIEQGLGHQQAEIRGSAFEAICASLKSTNTPTPEELSLIKSFLVMSSKEVTAGNRMNTIIGLKNVFFRIKETLRLARKQNGGTVAGETQPSNEKALALSFKRWVQQFVITSVYPGATPQRTILGLEVMLLYLQVFGLNEDSSEDSESLFLRPQVVSVLLNVLVSSWDIVRSLAFSILDLYPTDLPGYTTHDELSTLLNWSLKLCVSPRQRESDAGALFMRVIFKRSVSIQRFGVVFDQANGRDTRSAVKDSDASFVLKLTSVVLRRLHDCEKDRSRQSESPLVHGLLLALRYIVESVDFEKIASDKADALRVEWQTSLRQVFLCIDKAMQASLSVVGDATSGVGDEELSANFAGVVGEVSAVAKSATPALKVDCRGHLIIEDNGDEEEYGSDSAQRAVVGSWLAARECGAIMDTLMKRVPLPVSDASKETKTQFFTTEMAQRGGEMLLNSLFELKHKGAVAMAYQSFEGVCKAFLAHAERNTVLGGLPRVWADRLLTRLETSQQVFILRRSSGFAYSFVSILRAEPRNSAAVILPLVMSNLLRLASLDTDSVALTKIHEDHHLLWRSRVHALNILKLICQDAVLADDVSVYVSQMLEVAIFGFDCESWAVRNSSMMLFAATTQRAVGDKRIADNATSRKVSSTDVFSRFPQLSEFLHRELVRFTAVANSTGETAENARGTTPPGLFPILMLLSRLKPGEDDDAHALVEGVHLSDMVPSVMKCAAQPTMAIRHMAAKVLAAIVRDTDALSILHKLCAELPSGVVDPASTSAQSSSTTPKTNNYIHGLLSQIHQLAQRYLDVSADAAASDTQRSFAELVVAKVVGQKLWLISASTNPAIRAELLQIVDVAVKFCESRSGRELAADTSCAFGADLRSALAEIEALCARELTARCAAPSTSSPYYRQHHDPGMYVVDRTLVSIFFGLWRLDSTCHGAEQKTRFDLALYMLTSPVLQVRKRSIKQLSNLLTRFESANKERVVMSAEMANELQSVLATQLLVEVHPKIKVRILHLMVHYEEKQASRLSDDLARKLMAKIVFVLENVADADVAAPALELLALLSPQYLDDSAIVTLLRDQIVLRADEKQPLALRRAAAKALQHCDVLSLSGVGLDAPGRVQVAVDCWLSAIKLLQDDDANTRRLANAASAKGLTSQSSVPEHSKLSDTLALPLAIEHVVVAFGSTEYGSSRLLKVLEALIDAPTELQRYLNGAASKDLGAADLSSRIFEAESDNYFAESDLMAQNLAFQMLHQHRRQLFNASDACDTVVTAALSALSLLEQASNTGANGNDWLGGASFYPGVFPALQNVAMAAAAAAFSAVSEDGGVPDWTTKLRLLAQQILANASNGYPLHPLTQQALQVLAAVGDDDHGMLELVYLTPFWNALKA